MSTIQTLSNNPITSTLRQAGRDTVGTAADLTGDVLVTGAQGLGDAGRTVGRFGGDVFESGAQLGHDLSHGHPVRAAGDLAVNAVGTGVDLVAGTAVTAGHLAGNALGTVANGLEDIGGALGHIAGRLF